VNSNDKSRSGRHVSQQEIKEDLQTERKEYGDYNNLVVVATGVGKTVSIGVNYSQSRRMGYNDNRQDTSKIQSSS